MSAGRAAGPGTSRGRLGDGVRTPARGCLTLPSRAFVLAPSSLKPHEPEEAAVGRHTRGSLELRQPTYPSLPDPRPRRRRIRHRERQPRCPPRRRQKTGSRSGLPRRGANRPEPTGRVGDGDPYLSSPPSASLSSAVRLGDASSLSPLAFSRRHFLFLITESGGGGGGVVTTLRWISWKRSEFTTPKLTPPAGRSPQRR